MRNVLILAMVLIVATSIFAGISAADENYHGEDDEQPCTGAAESPGDGLPLEDTGDTGESPRTRFKDR